MADKIKTSRIEELRQQAKKLPAKSGCYLMLGSKGEALYVGKAGNLRVRVSSWLGETNRRGAKASALLARVRAIDFQLAASPAEALVLENNLIKKRAPKYNVVMRDDSSYPYVALDRSEPFARLVYRRRAKRRPGRELFGPFGHGSGIAEVLRIIVKSFRLRDCTLREFNSRREPCLLHQIDQCSAPCVAAISPEDYQRNLEAALDFFRGKGKKSLVLLEERMHRAALELRFEEAAIIRDDIAILRKFLATTWQQNAELYTRHQDIDIFAWHEGERETDIALYMVRKHILCGHKHFHFLGIEREEVAGLIFRYYKQTKGPLPTLVVSALTKEERQALAGALGIGFSPPGKNFASLARLTRQQAREQQRIRLAGQGDSAAALEKLAALLGLADLPLRLEGYDIAIFQGCSPAAAKVVFLSGRPLKKEYRHYRLKTRPEGNNDFAMLKEVLSRRLKRPRLPDVFVVDGGKGQMSAFREVLRDFQLTIPVVGIVKGKSEKLFLPGRNNPYQLSKHRPLQMLLARIRDEAHRFSRRLHHRTEEARLLASWPDEVPGIGPLTRNKILRRLDVPREELAKMSVEQLQARLGVGQKTARQILAFLGKQAVNQ